MAMLNMNMVFARFGLRRTTFSTLALVVNNPGLRQSRLAEALAIGRSNFVQAVGELAKAGLVEREADCGDKRAYALHVTRAGQIADLHQALRIIDINANCSNASDEY
jgi:DNA-binding MarR family transcriptional regulator